MRKPGGNFGSIMWLSWVARRLFPFESGKPMRLAAKPGYLIWLVRLVKILYFSRMNQMRMRVLGLCVVAMMVTAGGLDWALAELPDGVRNTQRPEDEPVGVEETLSGLTMPDGFKISVFAAEPHVYQPIAMEYDDRGRLWVIECFSYPGNEFAGHDRISIYEDTDSDGQFNRKTIFAEGGSNWTGLAIGYGGCWVTAAPELLFIPDANRDDRPDREPEVILDGFTLMANHNFVNGLTWGADGWLYGRHGILATSYPGIPGVPKSDREAMRCGIWRIHPVTHTFEIVMHGTTNPWGLDYDEFGMMFISNSVIEHMFQVIHGARFKRMFGKDFDPEVYELMHATSDHLHWMGEKWQQARGGDKHDALGGGHAHSGGMIYLGHNWPEKYRGRFFADNYHGNRIIQEKLSRKHSAYTASHLPDFLRAMDPWFRIVELAYGPDGGVHMIDWRDLGECHDSDGSHKSSGRIYKVSYGQPEPVAPFNLQGSSNASLVILHTHPNEWYVRKARRILNERCAYGLPETREYIKKSLREALGQCEVGSTQSMKYIQTLFSCDLIDMNDIRDLMIENPEERIRYWGWQWLAELDHEGDLASSSMADALNDGKTSAMDHLGIAAGLMKMSVEKRHDVAEALIQVIDPEDHNLNVMTWMAVKPIMDQQKNVPLQWLPKIKSSKLRQWVTRKWTADRNK